MPVFYTCFTNMYRKRGFPYTCVDFTLTNVTSNPSFLELLTLREPFEEMSVL